MICQSKTLETLMPLEFLFKKKNTRTASTTFERESRLQNDNQNFLQNFPEAQLPSTFIKSSQFE